MSKASAIDLNYARQLAKNYQATLKQTDDPNLPNTRAVWFDKEILLTALGLPADTNTGNITGLRFYFAAYEEQVGYPKSPGDYNKLTLVMVQTGKDSVSVTRDGKPEIVFRDLIEDPIDTAPSYPDPSKPVTGKNYFNDAQVSPPPGNGIGMGLLDW